MRVDDVFAILSKRIDLQGATPSQIQEAVNKYLSENPVDSVTEQSIKEALGYTPADQDDVNELNEKLVQLDKSVLYTEQDLTDEQKEQARANLWSKIPSVNMFNPATLTQGYYIDHINGTLNANGDIYYTYIPIPNAGNYVFKVAKNKLGPYQSTFIPLFDAEKNFVRRVTVTPLEDNATTEGQLTLMTLVDSDIVNVKYFGFNVYKTEINKAMVVEGTEYPTSYIPYAEVMSIPELKINSESMEKKQDNPLYKKVVAFTGDSICNGREDNGGSYPAIIGTNNSMIVQNLGISGGKITSGTESFCISESVLNMREDADYVILEGGVNDMGMDNLGTISNNFTAELDTTTFCGAFEQMIKNAIARFPSKKIGYISVHRLKQWAPDDYNTLHQNTGYYEAAINICKKWGIPVCNLTINCPSLYENDSLKQMYTTNADGWHPNEEGYRKYYVPKIEAWMKTL